MTRIRMNPDGTRVMLSWSYFGDGDADEALRLAAADLEEGNRQALAIWNALSPEERVRRTEEFYRKQAEDIPAFLRVQD